MIQNTMTWAENLPSRKQHLNWNKDYCSCKVQYCTLNYLPSSEHTSQDTIFPQKRLGKEKDLVSTLITGEAFQQNSICQTTVLFKLLFFFVLSWIKSVAQTPASCCHQAFYIHQNVPQKPLMVSFRLFFAFFDIQKISSFTCIKNFVC